MEFEPMNLSSESHLLSLIKDCFNALKDEKLLVQENGEQQFKDNTSTYSENNVSESNNVLNSEESHFWRLVNGDFYLKSNFTPLFQDFLS